MVADGVDVAVRFGPPPASSLVAQLFLATRILTVAAPVYLERRGRPKAPADLITHPLQPVSVDPLTGRPIQWEFHRRRKIVPVDTTGPLTVTDVGTMLSACLHGLGIAQVMALGAQDLLQQGRLIELFPDWPDERFPLYAVHPSRHNPPAKVRAFIDFCKATIGS